MTPRWYERRFLLRIATICIVIIAIWIRLLPIAMLSGYDGPRARSIVYYTDARGYRDFASKIYKEGPASLLVDDTDHSQEAPPTAFRTPLYPAFIAAVSSIFGERPEPVLVAQLLLDLCVLWLVYLIAIRVSRSPGVALAAMALYAVNPLAAMYVSSAYAECLFSFFLVAGAYAFIRAVDASTPRDRRWRFAFLGIVIGLGALTKPVGIFAVPVYIVAIVVERRSKRLSWRDAAIASALVLFFFVATIAPWQLRNLYVYGHYSLTFQQGREMLVWRAELCRSGRDNPRKRQYWQSVQKPFLGIYDYYERSTAEESSAIAYMRANPIRMVGCHIAGVERFFFADKLFYMDQDSSIRAAAGYFSALGKPFQETASAAYRFSQYPAYALALFGLALLFIDSRRRSVAALFVGFIAYLSQTVSVDGYSRYNAPLQAVYAILIAIAAAHIIGRLSSPRSHALFHSIRLRCRSARCRIFRRR